ncbi:MAG: DinB family protein [Gemmatimonadaceae bacterium]
MTNTTHEGERLADQIVRAAEGGAWHGPSLHELLTGVAAAQAAARPVREAHSIWELVLHLSGWTREVTRRIRGGPAGAPPAGDWPAVGDTDDAAWDAARAELAAAHTELAEVVRALGDDDLSRMVHDEREPPEGTRASVYGTVSGALQHTLYHAGQMALLRKARH